MKKLLLTAISCLLFASTSPAQHTQSLSLSGSSAWIPGTTVMLSVSLTFSGYSSFGLSYWLEVPNTVAPFLSITNVNYFTFLDGTQGGPNPAPFNSTMGATSGFMSESRDLGATTIVIPQDQVPPGTYHITDVTISIAPNVPLGAYTLQTTTLNPRTSEVTDTTFQDNDIVPAAQFTFAIIPEPGTLSLLSLAIVGFGLIAYRHRPRV